VRAAAKLHIGTELTRHVCRNIWRWPAAPASQQAPAAGVFARAEQAGVFARAEQRNNRSQRRLAYVARGPASGSPLGGRPPHWPRPLGFPLGPPWLGAPSFLAGTMQRSGGWPPGAMVGTSGSNQLTLASGPQPKSPGWVSRPANVFEAAIEVIFAPTRSRYAYCRLVEADLGLLAPNPLVRHAGRTGDIAVMSRTKFKPWRIGWPWPR
jgi:hypothetical protein